MTKSQLSTQQQQREVLRQLAAEQSYDPTGKRKVIKYFNIPCYLYGAYTWDKDYVPSASNVR